MLRLANFSYSLDNLFSLGFSGHSGSLVDLFYDWFGFLRKINPYFHKTKDAIYNAPLNQKEGISMKKCQFCAEEVQDEAIKCKHCGEMLGQLKTFALLVKDRTGRQFECSHEAISESETVAYVQGKGFEVLRISQMNSQSPNQAMFFKDDTKGVAQGIKKVEFDRFIYKFFLFGSSIVGIASAYFMGWDAFAWLVCAGIVLTLQLISTIWFFSR